MTPPLTRATTRTTRGPSRHRRMGLTFVEMLLTLAITTLIGAGIALMLAAVAHGTESSRDLRDAIVRSKTLTERLMHAVHRSHGIIAYDEDYLVLRVLDDAGESYQEQRIELEYDAQTDTHHLVSVRNAQREVWGRGISAWSVKLDHDDPATAALVSFRVTLQIGDLEHAAIGAAALRN